MEKMMRVAFVTLLLAGIAFLMPTAVHAKKTPDGPSKQKMTVERPATELKPQAPKSSFSGHFGKFSSSRPAFLKDICSGSCSCSVCSCYGTEACCSAGCDACWDYRDSQGLCNAF